jgi:hypothetical protein
VRPLSGRVYAKSAGYASYNPAMREINRMVRAKPQIAFRDRPAHLRHKRAPFTGLE